MSLPAPGLGALGIEVREASAVRPFLTFLNDADTRTCCIAERAVSRALGGSCQVPLAAYCIVQNGELWLRAHVGDHRTGEMITAEARGAYADPLALAARVVQELETKGARSLLEKVLRETAA